MLAGPEQRIWGWEAAGLMGGLVAHPIIAMKIMKAIQERHSNGKDKQEKHHKETP